MQDIRDKSKEDFFSGQSPRVNHRRGKPNTSGYIQSLRFALSCYVLLSSVPLHVTLL